jgi:hypothetical protein
VLVGAAEVSNQMGDRRAQRDGQPAAAMLGSDTEWLDLANADRWIEPCDAARREATGPVIVGRSHEVEPSSREHSDVRVQIGERSTIVR